MEPFFRKAAGLQLVRKGMRLAPPPSLFNPLNASVALIYKLVNRFAQQIN